MNTIAFVSVELKPDTPTQVIDLLKQAVENSQTEKKLPYPQPPTHQYFENELWKFIFDSITLAKIDTVEAKYPYRIFNAQFYIFGCGMDCFTPFLNWVLAYAFDGFHGYFYMPDSNPRVNYLIHVEYGKPYFYCVELWKKDKLEVSRSLITNDGWENE